jgi:adenosylhomocysteine nucleosidase
MQRHRVVSYSLPSIATHKTLTLVEVPMITVVAALDSELAGIRRRMEIADSFNVGEVRIEQGRLGGQDCLLVQSGMGRQRAEQALRYVLDQYQPVAVLSLGFCGALAATLRVGDLVVCSPVGALLTMPSGPHVAPSPVGWLHCDGSLAQQALAIPMPPGLGQLVGGGCLTVPSAAGPRGVKQWLSESFVSVVVDMESFWIGSLAQEAGVPFLVVRSVSDTLAEWLPSFDGLIDDFGRASLTTLSRYLLHHPLRIAQLGRLGLQSQRAEKSLTYFTVTFLMLRDVS